jgi:hypothetical protein
MEKLFLVRWQNNSGDWFEGKYPAPSHLVIYEWKCSSCNRHVELRDSDNNLLSFWIQS